MAVSMGRYPRTCNSGSKRSPKVLKRLCCLVLFILWSAWNSLMFEEGFMSFFTRSFPFFHSGRQHLSHQVSIPRLISVFWCGRWSAGNPMDKHCRGSCHYGTGESTKYQGPTCWLAVYGRSSDHYIYTQPTHKLPTFGSFSGSRKLGWSYYKTTIYWRFIGYHWIRLEYLGYIRGIFMYRSMNFHQLAMRDMPVRACGTVCRVHSLRLLSPGFWWLVQDPFIYLYNILPLKMNRWKPQGCRWLVSWWNFFS